MITHHEIESSPYQIPLSCWDNIPAMVEWCTQQFGEQWRHNNGTWTFSWEGVVLPTYYRWYFMNQEDYSWFLLRWK